jgi:hypothetical protein
MRRETFLEVLNAEARSLSWPTITDRMLRDWILEDLFPGPTEKGLGRGLGSERRYSSAALAAGLEVVRLRASGPRRNAALRLRLWLLDFNVPMDRIIEDLRSEFDRLLRRGFFRDPLRYDANSNEEYSERKIQAELRRAGPVDPDLAAAGLPPPSGDILNLASELVWGSDGPTRLLTLLEARISPFVSENGLKILSEFLRGLEPYVATTGLFGSPDEIEKSGLEVLATIGEGDLLKGRRFYQFALAMADWAARGGEFLSPDVATPTLSEALSKIARSLRDSDEWCIAGLAVCSIAAHRAISASQQK